MSALDDIIVAYQDAGGLRTALPPKARAELVQLRAQLDEAREIFENIFKRDWTNSKIHERARDWLSDNFPAPAIDAYGKLNADYEWHHEQGSSWTQPKP